MNRIDRLFALTLQLQRKPLVTAKELAVLFGLSERTIYRDMQALIEIGLPIASMPGEGYRLLDSYRLPPLMLKQEEAIALFISGKMLQKSSIGETADAIEQALGKLYAVLPELQKKEVTTLASLIDFYPMPHAFDWNDTQLRQILEAARDKRVVSIRYQRYMSDEVTQREIEPEALTFSDGAWYISAYCRLRQAMRSFRLSRVLFMQVKDEVFTRAMPYEAAQTTIEVRIRFGAEVLRTVHERQHYGFRRQESDLIFVYAIHDLAEIRDWVLAFGSHAEVLTPSKLREWIVQEVHKMISLLT